MAGYDLKSAVNKVKEKRLNFGLYRGEEANHVLITAAPASAKQVAEIEKDCGPTKRLVKGLCFWENGKLVFASKTSPAPAWEMLIVKVFKDHKCSSFLPVELRKLGDNESDEVHGSDDAPPTPGAPGGEIPQAPPQQTAPQTPAEAAALFAARLKAVKPKIDQTIAAGGPTGDEVKVRLSELGYFARKQEFAQAGGILDQIERMLGGAPSGTSTVPPPPVPQSPPPPPPGQQKPPAPPPPPGPKAPVPPPPPAKTPPDFMARLKELKPKIDQALAANGPSAGEIKLRFSEMGTYARKQDFANAGAVLDQIERLLGGASSSTPPPTQEPPIPPPPPETGEIPPAPPPPEPGAIPQPPPPPPPGSTKPTPPPTGGAPRQTPEGAPSRGIPKGIVAYRKALLEFNAAKQQVAAQISAFEKALGSTLPQEKELAGAAAAMLNEYNEALGDLIDQAMSTSQDEREPINDDIRDEIEDYIADLAENELIQHIDTNRYARTTIAATLTAALTKIVQTIV